jgi:hypothetical protein
MDDCSHLTDHVITTFNYAFLHCLAEGGIYFIEDLNTSYWENYRTSNYSAMDMVLSLSEMTHQFYLENHYQDYNINNYKFHYNAPLVSTILSEVRVFDSAAAIYKKSHYPPLVFTTEQMRLVELAPEKWTGGKDKVDLIRRQSHERTEGKTEVHP